MSFIVYPRLVSPPNSGDRNVYQRYPLENGFGGTQSDAPFKMVGWDGEGTECLTGQWYKTLPERYPRKRTILGPSTVKHIYGTRAFDSKGVGYDCRTGAEDDHESFGYNYAWIPKDTMGYDASAPLGPDCCPIDSPSEHCDIMKDDTPQVYRVGQYLNPRYAFRTHSTALWPANGRYVREPRAYTRYSWSDGYGHALNTTAHPRPDPTSPPIARIV